ncbi:MAG: hypothetical protein ACP5E9_09460 [Candidatus Methanospirareceae archaeon]
MVLHQPAERQLFQEARADNDESSTGETVERLAGRALFPGEGAPAWLCCDLRGSYFRARPSVTGPYESVLDLEKELFALHRTAVSPPPPPPHDTKTARGYQFCSLRAMLRIGIDI